MGSMWADLSVAPGVKVFLLGVLSCKEGLSSPEEDHLSGPM